MQLDPFQSRHALAFQLAQELVEDVRDIVRQPYGHAGVTFAVDSPNGSYVLKTREELGCFDHTERHLNLFRSMGIPVSELLRKGHYHGFEYLLLRMIPGSDLGYVLHKMTEPEMIRLAGQIVEIQRKVGSLPEGQGFGWTPLDVPGPFPTWTAVIERDSSSAPSEVKAVVELHRPYFDRVRPTCFLDDLTVKNVIIEEGQLQGIVDLDHVCFGDPLYWLSLAETTIVLDIGTEPDLYSRELRRLWSLTDEEHAVCNLYCAVHASSFLRKAKPSDAWEPRLRTWSEDRLRNSK